MKQIIAILLCAMLMTSVFGAFIQISKVANEPEMLVLDPTLDDGTRYYQERDQLSWGLGFDIGSSGANIYSVAVGDMDNDGDLDIVSVEGDDDTNVRVWQNDGTPWGTWTSYVVGTANDFYGGLSIAIADIDNDGWLDIVVGDAFPSVYVWKNDGTPWDGGWTKNMVWEDSGFVFYNIQSVAVGDFDNDGWLDIASGESWDGGNTPQVRAFKNDGSPFVGTWPSVTMGVGADTGVNTVTVGDLDNDGCVDIISCDTACYVRGFQNDGTPFDAGWTGYVIGDRTAAWEEVRTVSVGDIDNDGWLDVVSGDYENRIYVWQNDGTPWNAAWVGTDISGDIGNDPDSVVVGDLDNDGYLDIVVGITSTQIVWVFENDHTPFSGTWEGINIGTPGSDIHTVAIGDLDNDGDLDIVSGHHDPGKDIYIWKNTLIHRNMPFDSSIDIGGVGDIIVALAAADLDNDGDLDIITGDASFGIDIWENDGTPWGTWTNTTVGDFGAPITDIMEIIVGDFNNNGMVDIISFCDWTGDVWLWENDGTPFNGAWAGTLIADDTGGTDWIYTAAVGDLDNDGDLDFVTGAGDCNIRVWNNSGAGFFSHYVIGSTGSERPLDIALGDLDNDGWLDIICGDRTDNLTIWKNDGTPFAGVWANITIDNLGNNVNCVAVGDLDNDGWLDISTGDQTGNVTIWENDETPFTGSWNNVTLDTFGDINGLAIADLNNDGWLDILKNDMGMASLENDGTPWNGFGATTELGIGGVMDDIITGDLDNDGDLDIACLDNIAQSILVGQNIGAQVSETVTDISSGFHDGGADDLMKIIVTHNGIPGDSDIELATWRFTFYRDDGTTDLTDTEMSDFFANYYIYLDNGDGIWELITDTIVATGTSTYNIAAFSFTDGDANVQIAQGNPRTYFFVTEMTATPSNASINSFRAQFDPDGATISGNDFFDDMESGSSKWITGGTNCDWELGAPTSGPGAAYSGSNVSATNLTGNYASSMDAWIQTANLKHLSYTPATLNFYHWFNSEAGWDYGYVEISTTNGASWIQLGSSYDGILGGWSLQTRDLSPYVGEDILIRFRLYSDGGTEAPGWYIDDVEILGCGPGGFNEVEDASSDKIVSVVATSATLTNAITISIADPEPNGDFATACLITPGSYSGSVSGTDLNDYYKLILTEAGQTVYVNNTVGAELEINLILYNETQTEKDSDYFISGGVARVDWCFEIPQTIYILVQRNSGAGIYNMTVEVLSQNDAYSGEDAGNDFGNATPVTPGTYLNNFLKIEDYNDYYKLTLTEAGQIVYVNVTVGIELGINLLLYNETQAEKDADYFISGGVARVDWCFETAQTVYIYVGRDSGEGIYNMTVEVLSQNDTYSGGDAGNDFGVATPITPGTYLNNFLKRGDIDDYYELILAGAGQTVYVNATVGIEPGINLLLYNETQAEKDADWFISGGVARVDWCFETAQTVYIYVGRDSGEGIYNMTVEVLSQNDTGSGGDAGNGFATATPITPGIYLNNFLKREDSEDYYKLVLTEPGQVVYVNTTIGIEPTINLYLYNETQEEKDSHWGVVDGVARVDWCFEIAQTIYIRVGRNSGEGIYNMTVDVLSQNDTYSGGDAGNNFATATPVSPGTYLNNFLKTEDNNDYYELTLTGAGQTVYVNATIGINPTINLFLYNETQTEKDADWLISGGVARVEWTFPTAQTIYIYVERSSGEGYYDMEIAISGIEDTTPPTIISTTPTNGEVNVSVASGMVIIEFSEPMDTTVTGFATNLPGASGAWDGTGMWFNVSYTALAESTEYYTDFTGQGHQDTAGWVLSDDTNKTFTTGDFTAPTSSVDMISPYWQGSSPLIITATASDANGIANVTLWYEFSTDNGTWPVSWTKFGLDDASPWNWTFNFPDGEGYYKFYSIAIDTANNTEAPPATADASCAYDITPPNITDNSPAAGTTGDSYTFLAVVTDNLNLSEVHVIYWFGSGAEINSTMTHTAADNYVLEINIPLNSLDTLHYRIAAVDEASNWNSTAIKDVQINDNDDPDADAGPDQPVDEGTIVTFNGSGSTDNIGIVNYTWTFNDGVQNVTLYGAAPTQNFTTAGNYTLTLTVEDAAGNNDTDTMIVSVNSVIIDSDGDGVPDTEDEFPDDPDEDTDTDGDGVGDNSDAFPDDANETADTDGDGTGDNSDAFPNDPAEDTDTDGDGVGDNSDAFPDDPDKWENAGGIGDYWWIILLFVIILLIVGYLVYKMKGRKSSASEEHIEEEDISEPPSED